jgi:Carboxypeptidase regulatory-like domain
MTHNIWKVRAYRAAFVALTAYFTLVACIEDPANDEPVDYTPSVTITAPENWTEFTVGTEIRLEGTADDNEDGVLQGDALVWQSDLEGEIGTGSPLTVSHLRVGLHKITLTATDSKGHSRKSSILPIPVLPEEYGGTNGAPVVTLLSPNGNYLHYAVGETIVLDATVEDPEEGPLTGDNLVWHAVGPGSHQWTGNRVEVSDLPVGAYEVWLRAVDQFGEPGYSRYIYFTVGLVESAAACDAVLDPNPIRITPNSSDYATVTFDLGVFPPIVTIELEDGPAQVSDVFSSVTTHIGDGFPAWFEYTANPILVGGQTHELTLRAYVFDEEQPYTCTMPLAVETYATGSNATPEATITSPMDGAGVYEGAMVTFSGTGTDLEDGTLTGASLVWESSIDGQIGTGETFQRDDLSLGVHTITLRVIDSNGATATATAQLNVLQQGSYASIDGTVTYAGEPVSGVFVTLSGAGTATTVTSGNGYYYFPNLTAGTYTVTIDDYPSGMTFPSTSITITIGPYDNATVDFTG